jgi:hypothetical protein
MYSDYVQQNLADSYRAERLALARREQLLKQNCCYRPALRHRILSWSGDRLIDVGRSLKQRYEPFPTPALAPDSVPKLETLFVSPEEQR